MPTILIAASRHADLPATRVPRRFTRVKQLTALLLQRSRCRCCARSVNHQAGSASSCLLHYRVVVIIRIVGAEWACCQQLCLDFIACLAVSLLHVHCHRASGVVRKIGAVARALRDHQSARTSARVSVLGALAIGVGGMQWPLSSKLLALASVARARTEAQRNSSS